MKTKTIIWYNSEFESILLIEVELWLSKFLINSEEQWTKIGEL